MPPVATIAPVVVEVDAVALLTVNVYVVDLTASASNIPAETLRAATY